VSRDGKFVAVGGNYPYLKLIDTDKNNKIHKHDIETGEMLYCSFTPDNKKLIYLGSNKRIMMWDFVKSHEIAKSDLKVNTIDMDPNGQYLAVGKAKGVVSLIDLRNENEQRVLFESATNSDITSVKFSADGKTLAVGDIQGMVRIIHTRSGQVGFKLPGHTAMINRITFSHDGQLLATASFDHTVRIWSLNNPLKQPILLDDHDDWVWSVEFSYDDKYLYAGCRDKLIRTWMMDINQMAQSICEERLVSRNFSAKEWVDFVADDIDYECTCEDMPPGIEEELTQVRKEPDVETELKPIETDIKPTETEVSAGEEVTSGVE